MQYAGTNVYPVDFALADDGVPPTASEVNVGLEALGDRTTWLHRHHHRTYEFLANNPAWVAPEGATHAIAIGFGGGGGAGGGADAVAFDDAYAMAGGGGGAAERFQILVPLVGGESYDIEIGQGGNGGAPGTNGLPGGATILTRVSTSDVLALFGGGGGGGGHTGSCGAYPNFWTTLGGLPWDDSEVADWIGPGSVGNPKQLYWLATSSFGSNYRLPPGAGGAAVCRSDGRPGLRQQARGISFGSPGFGGPQGAHSSNRRGGGGGGGGAAGHFGAGGDGGAGGVGNDAGAAGAGVPGGNATANSGAGGGGGGAGGAGNNAPNCGVGAPGGKGGSGRLSLIVFGAAPP